MTARSKERRLLKKESDRLGELIGRKQRKLAMIENLIAAHDSEQAEKHREFSTWLTEQ